VQVITFNDAPGSHRVLNGPFPPGVIDWGTAQWWLSGPYGAFTTKSIGFNGPGLTQATFSFVSPRRVVSVEAFNGGAATTVTLRCVGQPDVVVPIPPNAQTTIATGWTGLCNDVTIISTNGWDTNFDNLAIAADGTPPVPPAAQTITFNDASGQNRVLNGQYPAGVIDWGTRQWWLSGPYGAFTTKSIGFNGPGLTQATFSFAAPARLVSLRAYNGGAATTVTLRCVGQPDVVVPVAPNTLATINTGWTGRCSQVTILSTNGWDTNFDDLMIAFDGTLPAPPPDQTITFNDAPGQNHVLNGQYPAGVVDWGTARWWLSGPYGAFATKSIGFNGAVPGQGTLTFASPARLVSIDAYNGGAATVVVLRCVGQPDVVVPVAPNMLVTINTAWTGVCSQVTIFSSNGWDTNFDNVVIDGG
jgi:hypothetical protein